MMFKRRKNKEDDDVIDEELTSNVVVDRPVRALGVSSFGRFRVTIDERLAFLERPNSVSCMAFSIPIDTLDEFVDMLNDVYDAWRVEKDKDEYGDHDKL